MKELMLMLQLRKLRHRQVKPRAQIAPLRREGTAEPRLLALTPTAMAVPRHIWYE